MKQCEYSGCKEKGEKLFLGKSILAYLCVKHLKRVQKDFGIKIGVRK